MPVNYIKPQIHLGDTKVKHLVTVKNKQSEEVVDISQADTKIFRYFPNGVSVGVEKAGQYETDGTDGKLYYLMETDVTNIAEGDMRYEVEITLPDGTKWTSDFKEIYVKGNLP